MTVLARLALVGLLAWTVTGVARADEPLKATIGVLRLSSSAPVFIAQDKGYFREAGLDIDLKFFDAAQPIAVAVTSADIDFGITAFTAGLYNLAGKDTLKVIGGMSRERAGYPLIGYFASNNAYAAGLKTPKDLAGKRVAVTQVGSSFHYSLGLLADGKAPLNDTTKPLLEIIAKYTNLPVEQVVGNCAYIDPDGKLDVRNVANQIEWLQEQGFVDKGFNADAIIAKDYVKPD